MNMAEIKAASANGDGTYNGVKALAMMSDAMTGGHGVPETEVAAMWRKAKALTAAYRRRTPDLRPVQVWAEGHHLPGGPRVRARLLAVFMAYDFDHALFQAIKKLDRGDTIDVVRRQFGGVKLHNNPLDAMVETQRNWIKWQPKS